MLAIIAAVEFAVERTLPFKNETAESWAIKGKLASRDTSKEGVLIFGDSLLQYGVYPRLIEDETGRPSYNYALPGGSPESSLFLLERVLAAGARPDVILVDFPPFQTSRIPRLEEVRRRFLPEALDLLALATLVRSARTIDYPSSIAAASLLPSLKLRHEIRDSLSAALDGQSRANEAYCVTLTLRNLEANLGAIALPEGIRRQPDHRPILSDFSQPPDPAKQDALRRFLELATSRQIRVFWVIPPISPEFQRCSEYWGYDASQTRYVNETLARSSGCTPIDLRKIGLPWTAFHDGLHLNRSGATVVTRAVARVVAARSTGVGRFDARGGSPRIEDMYESSAVLGLVAPPERRR